MLRLQGTATSVLRSGIARWGMRAISSHTPRPRRSMLFVPGSNSRAMEKARGLACDTVILDLEDSVTPSAKDDARNRVVEAVSSGDWGGKEICVRINPLDTEWGAADLKAVNRANPHAVALPKVEHERHISELETLLGIGAQCNASIWAMIETPRGVLNAASIASCSPRVSCIVAGTSDLAKDLHAAHTADRAPLMFALQSIVLAARAAGKVVIDGVHLDIHDHEGFAKACRQGRDLGFNGKTLIHPSTIATANTVFAPSAEEVDHASRVIEAFEEARKEGSGVVVVDNKLVENLHVEEAHRVLALHDATASRGDKQ